VITTCSRAHTQVLEENAARRSFNRSRHPAVHQRGGWLAPHPSPSVRLGAIIQVGGGDSKSEMPPKLAAPVPVRVIETKICIGCEISRDLGGVPMSSQCLPTMSAVTTRAANLANKIGGSH
jgi:hypothetical protein